ncbi:hypothetical protein J2S47_000001 [Streptomyces griseoviridis]|uniref:Uncharacterized protein n=1 Tax=Streptomyces griseoviridis TaxID=45398 RepID=A0ABT9L714_STRGD|nr:hypothetical protein [Streptomyces griseoviridis]
MDETDYGNAGHLATTAREQIEKDSPTRLALLEAP